MVEKKNQSRKLVALTFDDGPNTSTTVDVLNQLKKYEVIGSFFVIGDLIQTDTAKIMKMAHEYGCEINNHSKTHSNMTEMKPTDIVDEITYTSNRIYEVIGEYPKFFRPPYIAVNDTMYDIIPLPFICGYGAMDWVESVKAKERAQRILDQVVDSSIILLHDMEGNTETVKALDYIIPELKRRGYTFVTVSELFLQNHVKPKNTDRITYNGIN